MGSRSIPLATLADVGSTGSVTPHSTSRKRELSDDNDVSGGNNKTSAVSLGKRVKGDCVRGEGAAASSSGGDKSSGLRLVNKPDGETSERRGRTKRRM